MEDTNVINSTNLVFTQKYIEKNIKIITYFIKGTIKNNDCKNIIVKDYELLNIVFDILDNIEEITSIYIEEDIKLSYSNCARIIENINLTYINCYDMPDVMFEKINYNNDIKIDLRCEVLLNSNFIVSNKLNTFSNMYYENIIFFTRKITKEDFTDFETFCKINKKLSKIVIMKFNKSDFDEVVNIVISNNIKNVKILIFTNDKNINLIKEEISYLKNINKVLKNNRIKIKLKYSHKYKEESIIKQVNFNVIKYCSIIFAFIAISILCFNRYYIYKANEEQKKLQALEKEIIEWVEPEEEIIEQEPPIVEEEPEIDEPVEKPKPKPVVLKEDYTKLLEINKDTRGWLKVGGTSVNHPVVQGNDNSYYLKYNFYGSTSGGIGSIFMDYRNNYKDFDMNTIIFGHNIRNTSLMFATLEKTLKESWFNNKDNHVITFNTLDNNHKWQIFSVYKTEPTNDYLQINFDKNGGYMEFIDKLKNRSMYNFDIEVTNDDHILTLSTCTEKGTKRLVIHAKLINI